MSSVADRPSSRPMVPPFSPVLLAGMALSPVPPSLFQPIFTRLIKMVCRRHPEILDAVASFAGKRVEIDPIDMPFALILEIDPVVPRLHVIGRRDLEKESIDAAIRAPLEILTAMVEGRIDGDAVFFSRQLTIEGDTEIVLALRNAIDGAGIVLAHSLAEPLGPLAPPAERILRSAGAVYSHLSGSLERIRQSLIAPAIRGVDIQSARTDEIETQLDTLHRKARREKTPAKLPES